MAKVDASAIAGVTTFQKAVTSGVKNAVDTIELEKHESQGWSNTNGFAKNGISTRRGRMTRSEQRFEGERLSFFVRNHCKVAMTESGGYPKIGPGRGPGRGGPACLWGGGNVRERWLQNKYVNQLDAIN